MISAEQLLRALLHAQLHGRAVEMLQGLCQPGASAPSDQVFNSMLDSTVSSAENAVRKQKKSIRPKDNTNTHMLSRVQRYHTISYYHFGSEVQFCWLLYS